MIYIENYLHDGANWQAQCVLAYLRHQVDVILEERFDSSSKFRHTASISVGRYENCREQGYVFSLCDWLTHKQMNYCVYEHRNCDSMCIIKFELNTMNTPTMAAVWKGRKDKYDYDKAFSYGDIVECGKWLVKEMQKQLQEWKKEYDEKQK